MTTKCPLHSMFWGACTNPEVTCKRSFDPVADVGATAAPLRPAAGPGQGAKPAAGSWKSPDNQGASGGADSAGIGWKPAFAADFSKIWSRDPAGIAHPAAVVPVSRRHKQSGATDG